MFIRLCKGSQGLDLEDIAVRLHPANITGAVEAVPQEALLAAGPEDPEIGPQKLDGRRKIHQKPMKPHQKP